MTTPSRKSRTPHSLRSPGRHPGASLGLRVRHTTDLIDQLQGGLSYGALKSFAGTTGLPIARVASTLEIPERTLARRRAAGKLAPDESERLFRLSRIFDKALGLFEGNRNGAVTWLTTARRALSDKTPLDYAKTEIGAREVEDLIGRLEHGVFS